MRLKRRILLLTVVLPLSLAGLVAALVMAPGSVEGVYHPFSTFGCAGDQFMDIRSGKQITYVTCAREAYVGTYYKKDPSGIVVFRLASDPDSAVLARAEPHLLGTRFHYPDDGTSEWKWKRIFTKKMKALVAGAESREIVFENGGMRIITYDSKFNVINSTFRPGKALPPTGAPGP
ncbi:MAG: hypothetical protein ACRDBP_04995 [Luteolibacter sp.]